MPPRSLLLGALALALALAAGCAAEDDIHDPLDFEPVPSDGKADGTFSRFDHDRLIPDTAFYDSSAMDAAAVQAFFEDTPYDRRSFLADLTMADGRLLSAALVDVARSRGINPLVLLTTLQKEAGLVSKTSAPSKSRVDFAFGCGCPHSTCKEAFRGLDKQLACAADRFAEYTADLVETGTTISGWGVGITKTTNDGVRVTPTNRSTSALYTYTPEVKKGTGGNWLFWNVWSRYARFLDYQAGLRFPFNEGFIGGNCDADEDCAYEGGRCLFAEPGHRGTCSRDCDSLCPDRAGGFATTFCVGDGSQGFCLAQCDAELSPTGCGENQACVPAARHGDPDTVKDVCMPLAP